MTSRAAAGRSPPRLPARSRAGRRSASFHARSRATPPARSPRRPPPAALVLGHDARSLRATADAVSAALGVRAVALLHADADGPSRPSSSSSSGAATTLALEPGPWPGCWRLDGTGEDAALCGADPTAGLCACLRLTCVACVVGVAREPSLGSDAYASRAVRSARAAALLGVPTVCACVPSASPDAPIEPAIAALAELLGAMRDAKTADWSNPANAPRAHFPFPTTHAWGGFGGPGFPAPDEAFAEALWGNGGGEAAAAAAAGKRVSSVADYFAAEDCWSLGGALGAAPAVRGKGSEGSEKSPPPSPAALRATLRRAFADGDQFLVVHVPPSWRPERGFEPARPGVLWRQNRVEPVGGDETDERHAAAARNHRQTTPRVSDDLWGRTLPAQTLGRDEVASERGARFVPQLATAKLVGEREAARDAEGEYFDSASSSLDDDDYAFAPPAGAAPRGFRVGGGDVVADELAGGDVDAALAGRAGIVAVPTWPQGHPFALLDDAAAEALRPGDARGLPAWIVE